MTNKISLEKCKYYFDYDFDGNLYWRIDVGRKIRKGNNAGYSHIQGYYRIKIEGKQYKLHRILYQLYHNIELENEFIDHINGIKDDNRKENLRMCSRSENMHNRKVNKNNESTGIKNITIIKNKNYDYFYIQIRKDGNNVYRKLFRKDKFTLEQVIEIRDKKLKEIHGEFANIQII